MTVLSAVQAAAPWIGITVPTVLFTATDRTSVEMQAFVNETAKAIAEDYDWQRLKVLNTITGDGSEEDWDLPADYARMPKKANLWPSDEPNSPMERIEDEDRWLGLDVLDFDAVTKRWIIYGNQIHIKPAIANAATVKHFYMSNKLIAATATPTVLSKTDFTVDTDEFFLGDRILKLGIIWRWKASKGRPYAEDMTNYNITRDQLASGDKGARILHIGTRRVPAGVTVAYPGVITP
jgi:hypothetical protein